jgi:hypothetical protein
MSTLENQERLGQIFAACWSTAMAICSRRKPGVILSCPEFWLTFLFKALISPNAAVDTVKACLHVNSTCDHENGNGLSSKMEMYHLGLLQFEAMV